MIRDNAKLAFVCPIIYQDIVGKIFFAEKFIPLEMIIVPFCESRFCKICMHLEF